MYPRILMVVPYFLPIVNGVSLYVYRLVKGLKDNGIEVCIHTIDSQTKDVTINDLDISGFNIRRFKYQWDNRKLCQPISYRYILNTISESGKFDIIHIHDFPKIINDVIIIMLKKIFKSKIPIIITPHGSGYVGPSKSKMARLYWNIGFPYYSLDAVDLIITGTQLQYDNFKQKYNSKTILIPYATLTQEYYIDNPPASNKIGSLNILYIGRIIQEKGIQHLLEAIYMIKKTFELKLICVGPDYGYRSELEKLADKLQIADIVEFTGEVEETEKLKYLRWCDVLVLPSYYEAFGIPIIEAMAHSRAVIATVTEGAKSLIENGKNGLIVDIGNASEIAASLKKLAENPKLRQALGEAGYKTAEKYKLETLIKSHIDVYERLYNS